MQKSNKIRLFLLYTLPFVLFCSYYPLFPLFTSASTNYELSLPLIWLFLFSVLSLKDFLHFCHSIVSHFKKHPSAKTATPLILLLFPAYLFLTSFWSLNPVRVILTSGVLGCIIITNVVFFTTFFKRINKIKLLKSFFFSSGFFACLCWLQCVLDVIGVSRDFTLLCRGCVSGMFGFPHPSGFAIEPQFMGNLLIAPSLLSLYYLFFSSAKISKKFRRLLYFFSFLFLSTLFLTFSRGAIYSFLISYVVLLGAYLIKFRYTHVLSSLPLIVFSFIFTLAAQGVFSQFSYTNDTFLSGIEKSLSQLSLGIISFNPDSETALDLPGPIESSSGVAQLPDSEESSVFSGYVVESTNTRLAFDRLALESSIETPRNFFFGVGLGSAGRFLFRAGKTTSEKEIVQNEYFSLLLETGIVGLILLVMLSLFLVRIINKTLTPRKRLVFFSLILAYVVSLNFFSGLPNALHIFIFPTFFVVFLSSFLAKHKSVID